MQRMDVAREICSYLEGDPSSEEVSWEWELTVEECEMLDACQLLCGMLKDLNKSLNTMKSFSAYE